MRGSTHNFKIPWLLFTLINRPPHKDDCLNGSNNDMLITNLKLSNNNTTSLKTI